MRYFACLVLSSCCALAGCTTLGGLDRLSLPENEPAATERIERIVQPGMPIEEARRLLERYGFRCRYEEALGIPYLYGVQVKERTVYPFRATWSTTIYYQYGLVTGVKCHYHLVPVERGVLIPPWRLRRYPAAGNKPDKQDPPTMVRKDTQSATS